jgi:hypothetical protein
MTIGKRSAEGRSGQGADARTDAHAGSDSYRGAFEENGAIVRHGDGN